MKDKSWLKKNWKDVTIVAIDIETSGQYPVADHICEVAAVKSVGGEVTDTYQALIKPPVTMTDFVIGIHGITNEMVVAAPPVQEIIAPFAEFIGDGIAVGHHSPFDVSFLVVDYEKHPRPLPTQPFLCSSLLSRHVIEGTQNHRLQTLVKHLGIDGGQAHRALDDAKACLDVTLHCIREAGLETLEDICQKQGQTLWWPDFSLKNKKNAGAVWSNLISALETKKSVEIVYMGGSKKGQPRKVTPVGIVLNPRGDYMVADDGGDKPKRFYIAKVKEAEIIY